MRHLALNFLASGSGKLSAACVRLVQVPVLLSYLGVEDYGRWLLLSSIPSWLTLANIGFGSVAANEMSMLMARGDVQAARSVFSSALFLITALILSGLLVFLPIAFILPWSWILAADVNRRPELAAAAAFLSASVLVSFLAEVFGGRFRAARKAHHAMWLAAIRPWLDIALMLAVLVKTERLDILAGAAFASSIVYLLATAWLSRRVCPDLLFSPSLVRRSWFPMFLKKGLAFQSFPLGNAILFQGSLLIVQAVLGPVGVALYGTARTLVRSVNQAMEMVNQCVWPELSLLLGANDLVKAARLHRLSVAASFVLAFGCTAILAIVGEDLYRLWTHSELVLSKRQLLLFLLPIPFNALWFTSSVVHVACNRHEALAVRYLVATSVGAIACFLLTSWLGIEGAALSALVVDVCLIPFVFRRSLQLTGDTFANCATKLRGDVVEVSRSIHRKLLRFEA